MYLNSKCACNICFTHPPGGSGWISLSASPYAKSEHAVAARTHVRHTGIQMQFDRRLTRIDSGAKPKMKFGQVSERPHYISGGGIVAATTYDFAKHRPFEPMIATGRACFPGAARHRPSLPTSISMNLKNCCEQQLQHTVEWSEFSGTPKPNH
jgi:hypothetical protein